MRRFSLWLLGCCALIACGKAHGPGPAVDSETHFLEVCVESCPGSLSCVCGVCTEACSTGADCSELSDDARCVPSASTGSQACAADAPARVCDLQCKADDDCASFGASLACREGRCRDEAAPRVALDSLPFASGGERIKARYYVADGAEQFRMLYDDKLGFACDFVPDAAGGGVHCVPATTRSIVYLDDKCEQPATPVPDPGSEELGSVGPPPARGDWVSEELPAAPGSSCDGSPEPPRATYRVGEEALAGGPDATGVTLFQMRDSECKAVWLQDRPWPSIVRVERQDPKLLVAGRVSTLSVGGGLSIRRVIAEDGAQITLGVLGSDDKACSLQSGGPCVPEPAYTESTSFYMDANCEQAAFFPPGGSECGAPGLGIRAVGDVTHVYELVATASTYFKGDVPDDSPGRSTAWNYAADFTPYPCQASTFTDVVFTTGRDVTSMFPKANVLRTGQGKVHVDRFIAPNPTETDADRVLLLDPGGQFIDDHARPCEIREAVDDSLRCVAERVTVHETGYFADPECSEPTYAAFDPVAEPPDLYVVSTDESFPSKITRLDSVKPYAGLNYQRTSKACVPVDEMAPYPLFVVDQEVPLDALAVVESEDL